MRLLLFGSGDIYRKYSPWLKKEMIIGLIDNDPSKQGVILDGYMIMSPEEAIKNNYDWIVIMSIHLDEIRLQLLNFGISEDKIINYTELQNHPEIIVEDEMVKITISEEQLSSVLFQNDAEKSILLMSYDMSLNGAALSLYYASKCLKQVGYFVVCVAWYGGELEQKYQKENVPIIIDSNLGKKTAREIKWIQYFSKIICNTLNYYRFLSDITGRNKIIWWLHDPALFYKNIDMRVIHKIDTNKIKICAAGPIAADAIEECRVGMNAEYLLYGLPDVPVNKKMHEKIRFVVIANVQPYKGQDVIIEAVRLLPKDKRKMIKVEIIGSQDSVYANKLKNEAIDLSHEISFLPSMSREMIMNTFSVTDVLVCPSRIDTMSMSVTEALQQHIPCIVSDQAGISRYINNGEDGFVFQSENIYELSEIILWCIDHSDKLSQIGEKARDIYDKFFSMKVFGNNLNRIINETYQ